MNPALFGPVQGDAGPGDRLALFGRRDQKTDRRVGRTVDIQLAPDQEFGLRREVFRIDLGPFSRDDSDLSAGLDGQGPPRQDQYIPAHGNGPFPDQVGGVGAREVRSCLGSLHCLR